MRGTTKPQSDALTRRERQIMDVLYKLQRATVGQVLAQLGHKPSYSTVRAQLRTLEQKGHVLHEEHGLRYVYAPVVSHGTARRSALRHLIETFFEGSVEKVVTALLGGEVLRPSPEELGKPGCAMARSRSQAYNFSRAGVHNGNSGSRGNQ
jgi:predicted transcriptional regulator